MIVEIFWVGGVTAHDHLECFFEVTDFLSEPMQVEVVTDVVLVDLHEELVAFEVAKPLDPPILRITVVVI